MLHPCISYPSVAVGSGFGGGGDDGRHGVSGGNDAGGQQHDDEDDDEDDDHQHHHQLDVLPPVRAGDFLCRVLEVLSLCEGGGRREESQSGGECF